MIKSDGSYTYFASDVAYHMEKFERGFDRVIDVWGADHHGYIPRMKAMLAGLGHPPEDLDVLLIQMVNLLRDGVPFTMGKRSGNFITLREVIDEVGRDACRFFFLMRRCDSQLDFDLELAKQQSSDNPFSTFSMLTLGSAALTATRRKPEFRCGQRPDQARLPGSAGGAGPDSAAGALPGIDRRCRAES